MSDYGKDRVKVSTHSMTFFNEDRIMLKLVYLEDAITVNINLPQVVDGRASYPQEMRHSVLLNQANVSALHTLIMEYIIPAFAEGVNKDAGVFTNRAKDQMLEAVVKDGIFYAMIHENIENRIPKDTYVFKFDKTQVIKNYDIKAVSFETEEIDAQFALFVKALEAFENLSNGITAHEYQYRQSYFLNQMKEYLYAMNDKFNLNVGNRNNNTYRSNSGSTNAWGNSGSNNSFTNSSAPNPVSVQEGTMDDVFGGMSELPFN